MNSERLFAIISVIRSEIDKTKLIQNLDGIISALQNKINQPGQQWENQLAIQLKTLRSAVVDVPSDNFSPLWKQVLDELGGTDLIGNNLVSEINNIFSSTQLTPALALEHLSDIAKKLRNFKAAIDNVVGGFNYLNIGKEDLAPGECEIGILIPRNAINGRLLDMSKELKDFNFIFRQFSEVTNGKADNFVIRNISSSDFLVYLWTTLAVGACLTKAIERIVNIYKTLLEVKMLKLKLDEHIPKDKTKSIEDHANTMMSENIDKIAKEIMEEFYKGKETGRKHELAIGITQSLNMIANRIDKGFNIEVRVGIESDDEGKADDGKKPIDSEYVQDILARQRTMQFLKQNGPAILCLSEKIEDKKQQK